MLESLTWATETGDVSMAGWWVAGTTIIAAIVAGISTLLTTWWQNKRQDRKDAISEWKEFTDKLQIQYDEEKKRTTEEINKLNTKLDRVSDEHLKCQIEMTKLSSRLEQALGDIVRLQAGAGEITTADAPIEEP